MAEINLTQAEAGALIAMAKHRVDNTEWDYPGLGGAISVPLVSADRREQFVLDLRRGRIDLAKGTYQNRGRQVVVLVRLDFGGAPHQNPDGVEMGSPHLHLYREYTVTNGPSRCLATDSWTSTTAGGYSMISCGTVASSNHRSFGEGYSHDQRRSASPG